MARFDQLFAFKIDGNLANRVREIAQREDRSVSATIRRLLSQAIEPKPAQHPKPSPGPARSRGTSR